LRANSADALTPAVFAALGLAMQPLFSVVAALAEGRLEAIMANWHPPAIRSPSDDAACGTRPARIEVLIELLSRCVSRRNRPSPAGNPRPVACNDQTARSGNVSDPRRAREIPSSSPESGEAATPKIFRHVLDNAEARFYNPEAVASAIFGSWDTN
jgi:hypothetical protein